MITFSPFTARRIGALLVASVSLAFAPQAWSQAVNDQPLRMILPMAAGSVGDTLARRLSVHLARSLGRAVIVDDLPGGGGITGTAQLVRAPKDGQTLALISSSHVVNPFIYKTVPFDALKDITPITVIGTSPFVLAVHPSFPAQNLREFIAHVKASPGKFNYGSSGNGSLTQLAMELLGKEAGLSFKHIPYKGLAAQVNDQIGGQVEFGFIPMGVAAPLIASGKLRALAVSSTVRTSRLPQVPTVAESGLPSYSFEPWLAIIGPAGLATAKVDDLYSHIRAALEQKDVMELLAGQDFRLISMTPEQTAAFMQDEMKRYAALVKYAGATAD
jgi:tripartite-type tricarboxylate transporter receptor subunit TctC